MNILLWVLQILLAIHTFMGATWKLANSTDVVPSLAAIPHPLWIALAVLEILCALALILPAFNRQWARLLPIAAILIAAEMLIFCGVHIFSGEADMSPVIYWLVVAAISAFIAFGRMVLKPLVYGTGGK